MTVVHKRNDRSLRVANLLWRCVADLFQKRYASSDLLLTISRVRVSPDLSKATVWFSYLGDGNAIHTIIADLKENSSAIRTQLAADLKLRNMPVLNFLYDKELEKADSVQRVLDKIRMELESSSE